MACLSPWEYTVRGHSRSISFILSLIIFDGTIMRFSLACRPGGKLYCLPATNFQRRGLNLLAILSFIKKMTEMGLNWVREVGFSSDGIVVRNVWLISGGSLPLCMKKGEDEIRHRRKSMSVDWRKLFMGLKECLRPCFDGFLLAMLKFGYHQSHADPTILIQGIGALITVPHCVCGWHSDDLEEVSSLKKGSVDDWRSLWDSIVITRQLSDSESSQYSSRWPKQAHRDWQTLHQGKVEDFRLGI